VSNATCCSASGAWSGTKLTSGSLNLFPTLTSTYTLTCSGSGGTVSKSVVITTVVISVDPVADPGGPYTGAAGQPMTFDGSGSTGNITQYIWVFGDGSLNGTGVMASHTYSAAGSYTARLYIKVNGSLLPAVNTSVVIN